MRSVVSPVLRDTERACRLVIDFNPAREDGFAIDKRRWSGAMRMDPEASQQTFDSQWRNRDQAVCALLGGAFHRGGQQ